MARKTIFLTLAAVAVGLLILGSVLTPEERGYNIYGTIYKNHGGDDGSMLACCEPNPNPDHCVVAVWKLPGQWKYLIPNLQNGDYEVWAEYEDELEICTSARYPVTIDNGDAEKDITIYWYECEDKP